MKVTYFILFFYLQDKHETANQPSAKTVDRAGASRGGISTREQGGKVQNISGDN